MCSILPVSSTFLPYSRFQVQCMCQEAGRGICLCSHPSIVATCADVGMCRCADVQMCTQPSIDPHLHQTILRPFLPSFRIPPCSSSTPSLEASVVQSSKYPSLSVPPSLTIHPSLLFLPISKHLHAQMVSGYSVCLIGLSIYPSEHPNFRETRNRKPLEPPQTGGCGIGRGLNKGESFHRFITQRSPKTKQPHHALSVICRNVGAHFWRRTADVFVCLWQPLRLPGIRFKGNPPSCDVLVCQQVWRAG